MNIDGVDVAVKSTLLQMDKFTLSDWVAEGASLAVDADGALLIDALAAPGGATIWYSPTAFEGDIAISWQIASIEEESAHNLNFIFHATATDGSDILTTSAQRTGRYKEYHQFPNYIITFVGAVGSAGHTRVRRDPGFRLVAEKLGKAAVYGKPYNLLIVFRQGHLQYYVDGELIHDVVDPDPLTRGRLAVRTWNSKLRLSKLAVYTLQ